MDQSSANNKNINWKRLYQIGGIAPFITLALYLSQMLIIILSRKPYPITVESWFALFQRSKFLGLIFLNALDIFSIAILGLMFLALFIALKSVNPSLITIAAFLAFLGTAVFVSARTEMVTATLTLSDLYASATKDAQQFQLLAAGQAIMSLSRGTPETIGFTFIAIASLFISIVMLQDETFGKLISYIGFLGVIITLADNLSLIIAPSLATILMPVNGLIWLIWWILVGRKLLQLARRI